MHKKSTISANFILQLLNLTPKNQIENKMVNNGRFKIVQIVQTVVFLFFNTKSEKSSIRNKKSRSVKICKSNSEQMLIN